MTKKKVATAMKKYKGKPISAAVLATSSVLVGVWGASLVHVIVPAEVQVAAASILTPVISYFLPDSWESA